MLSRVFCEGALKTPTDIRMESFTRIVNGLAAMFMEILITPLLWSLAFEK